MSRRRGAILPVVLFTVLLIGLLAAVYSFRVHADHAATAVISERLQSRLAAEAGVDWAKALLRAGRHDTNVWYHNPDAFHRIVIWAEGEDSTAAGTNDEYETNVAYRFSIVADDPTDDETYVRFGLTDEASKLNLNMATESQLLKLVTAAVEGRDDVDPQAIVHAILDWRDPDSTPRGEAGDTEGEYYKNLPKPYKVKNGPFDTVEELLLVKGVTPDVLFGEDFDRNGLLTDNENDGDLSFPPDNQDGILNRGLYPYLTALAYETDVSLNNRQRLYMQGPEAQVRLALEEMFPGDSVAVDFIVGATRKPAAGKKPDGKGPEGKNPTDGLEGSEDTPPPGGDGPAPHDPGVPLPFPGRTGPRTGTMGDRSPPVPNQGDKPQPQKSSEPVGNNSGADAGADADKRMVLAQFREDVPPSAGNRRPGRTGTLQQPGLAGQPNNSQEPNGEEPVTEGSEAEQPSGENPPVSGGSGDVGPGTSPIRSPADLMFPRKIGDDLVPSPLTPDHLAVLMDRTTVRSPEQKKIEGLVNINTAPRRVLECIEGLSAEQIDAILAARGQLDDFRKSTTAWLVSERVLDVETFAAIAPNITARAQQFRIESLGYSDHHGMVTRLEAVVDMLGPIPQTVHYRDISYLGASYPIREEDLEQQRAR